MRELQEFITKLERAITISRQLHYDVSGGLPIHLILLSKIQKQQQ